MIQEHLAFVGAGQMAEALAKVSAPTKKKAES